MIFWYFVALIIVLIIDRTKYFDKKNKMGCCRRRVRVLFRFSKLSLMYGFILRLLLEGTFTFCISVLLNYQALQWDNPTDKFEYIMTITFSIVLVSLPFVTAFVLLKYTKKLK